MNDVIPMLALSTSRLKKPGETDRKHREKRTTTSLATCCLLLSQNRLTDEAAFIGHLFAFRGGSRGRGGSATAAYIKISEEEIADDYPMPAQYVKEEEETDELVMWDEELADYALEDLPKSILTDFSLYNAEVTGRMAVAISQ